MVSVLSATIDQIAERLAATAGLYERRNHRSLHRTHYNTIALLKPTDFWAEDVLRALFCRASKSDEFCCPPGTINFTDLHCHPADHATEEGIPGTFDVISVVSNSGSCR